jgi:hypothetical protein
MKTLNYQEIEDLYLLFGRLLDVPMEVQVATNIATNLQSLQSAVDSLNDRRLDICKKYVQKMLDGTEVVLDGEYVIDNSKKDLFYVDVKALLEEEVEIDLLSISFDDLKNNNLKVTPRESFLLRKLMKED